MIRSHFYFIEQPDGNFQVRTALPLGMRAKRVVQLEGPYYPRLSSPATQQAIDDWLDSLRFKGFTVAVVELS